MQRISRTLDTQLGVTGRAMFAAVGALASYIFELRVLAEPVLTVHKWLLAYPGLSEVLPTSLRKFWQQTSISLAPHVSPVRVTQGPGVAVEAQVVCHGWCKVRGGWFGRRQLGGLDIKGPSSQAHEYLGKTRVSCLAFSGHPRTVRRAGEASAKRIYMLFSVRSHNV